MKTIALRFADNFAPSDGTIAEHKKMISEYGFVWYGKLGSRVSKSVVVDILRNKEPKILLIHSGSSDRYWAFIDCIQNDTPEVKAIPDYYRDRARDFNTWFRIVSLEPAEKNVLSICKVISSQRPLSEVSKGSMNPYFIIEVNC